MKKLLLFLPIIAVMLLLFGCGEPEGGEIKFMADGELVATVTEGDGTDTLPIPPAKTCRTFKYWYTVTDGKNVKFTPYHLENADFSKDTVVYAMYSTSHDRVTHTLGRYPAEGETCTRTVICVNCGDTVLTESTTPTPGIVYEYARLGGEVYVKSIGQVTEKNIILPTIVNGDYVVSIDHDAFRGSSIESIVIPASVKKIDSNAFLNCKNLKSVNFQAASPELIISPDAFAGCTALNQVTLPGANCKTQILRGAFSGATSLTDIYLPTGVSLVGEGAFSGATKLTVYCGALSKPEAWDASWCDSSTKVVWGYDGK